MIGKLLSKISKLLEILSITSFVALTLLIILQMASRYLGVTSMGWTDEILSFLTTYMVFLGISYLAERSGHVSVTLLAEALKGKPAKLMTVIIQLFNLTAGGLITYSAVLWLKNTASKVTPILQINYNIWYAAVIVFGIMFIVFNTFHFIESIKKLSAKE